MSLTVIAGTKGPQSATLTLDIDGKHMTTQSTGNGPVDAIFNAIHALVPHEAKLELYQVHAVTEGTDAQAEVSVRLSEEGRAVTGKGADPDTLVASAQRLCRRAQQADQPPAQGRRRRAAHPLDGCGVTGRHAGYAGHPRLPSRPHPRGGVYSCFEQTQPSGPCAGGLGVAPD